MSSCNLHSLIPTKAVRTRCATVLMGDANRAVVRWNSDRTGSQMVMMRRAKFLAEIAAFARFPRLVLYKYAALMHERNYVRGDVVVEAGSKYSSISFVMVRARAQRHGRDMREAAAAEGVGYQDCRNRWFLSSCLGTARCAGD